MPTCAVIALCHCRRIFRWNLYLSRKSSQRHCRPEFRGGTPGTTYLTSPLSIFCRFFEFRYRRQIIPEDTQNIRAFGLRGSAEKGSPIEKDMTLVNGADVPKFDVLKVSRFTGHSRCRGVPLQRCLPRPVSFLAAARVSCRNIASVKEYSERKGRLLKTTALGHKRSLVRRTDQNGRSVP
jgi:hypothetical protein